VARGPKEKQYARAFHIKACGRGLASVPARRVLTATFMGFALPAIVLGGIALFGVVAHDVASRRAPIT
jgi:hypothetical protein